jgi:hypothetical protein
MLSLLLFHPIQKTFDDFDEIYRYRFDDKDGEMIESDRELIPGIVLILRVMTCDYAIVIKEVWEENGEKYFTHDSAKDIVVRGRPSRNLN